MTLSLNAISDSIKTVASDYPLKKVTLFGSYADGSCTEESDVDLLVEFDTPSVSLFTLSGLKLGLEDILQKKVDVLHFPLDNNSLLEINKTLVVYEA